MPKESKFSVCKRIYAENTDKPRSEVVAMFIAEGVKPNSANVYYSKIKHPNGKKKKSEDSTETSATPDLNTTSVTVETDDGEEVTAEVVGTVSTATAGDVNTTNMERELSSEEAMDFLRGIQGEGRQDRESDEDVVVEDYLVSGDEDLAAETGIDFVNVDDDQ